MSGSFADHVALEVALEDHDRHERLAALLGVAEVFKIADAKFLRLAEIATACGFTATDPSARVLTWSRARIATFRRAFPRAA